MLYKKYHRNLVKQFKKGTKFKYSYSPHEDAMLDIVWKEPYYFKHNNCIEVQGKYDSTWLVLIWSRGMIEPGIKIVEENVIQKIS